MSLLNGGRADYKKMVLALGEGWWAGVGGGEVERGRGVFSVRLVPFLDRSHVVQKVLGGC